MITIPDWLTGIRRARAGDFQRESDLQEWMWCELRSQMTGCGGSPHSVERELILPGDAGRIDFVVVAAARFGIECKVKAAGDTWRQLQRYAPHFDALVLVTTRAHGDPPDIIDTTTGRPVPLIVLDLWKNF